MLVSGETRPRLPQRPQDDTVAAFAETLDAMADFAPTHCRAALADAHAALAARFRAADSVETLVSAHAGLARCRRP